MGGVSLTTQKDRNHEPSEDELIQMEMEVEEMHNP